MELITKIFLLFKIKIIISFNHCSQYEPKCFCPTQNSLNCFNFTSLNELNFSKKESISKLSSVKIIPINKTIRLNYNLNLNNLDLDEYNFELRLSNLKSIDLDENPLLNQTIKKNNQLLHLHLGNSTLNFHYRQKPFDWICDLVLNDPHLFPIFASFKHVFIGYFNRVNFTSDICPVVFKNARIEWLFISSITPENNFKFIQLNSTSLNLNSYIKHLQIQSSSITYLDHHILDRNVFKNIEKISIEFSKVYKIEKNLFKWFKHLKRLNLWLYNLKDLFQQDMTWLESLNLRSTKQFYLELNDESNAYTYPDEDLCLFARFPHLNRVYPIIRTQQELNCSCTLIWLLSAWNKSEKDIRTKPVLNCFKEFQTKLTNCKLNEKLQACYVTQNRNMIKLHMSNSSSCLIIFDFILLTLILLWHHHYCF